MYCIYSEVKVTDFWLTPREKCVLLILIILQINDLNDLKSKTAPLPNISAFDFHGNYCYNLCSLSCISCMLKFVYMYVLMGHMAYCMNKLLTYLLT